MDHFRKAIQPLASKCKLNSLIRLSGHYGIFPFYHTVARQQAPHFAHVYRARSPEEFEGDLDLLLKEFEAVSLGDYMSQTGNNKGKRSMVLSFDDGLKECHTHIAPLLRKKGVPAVFFLNNHFIDNRELFYRYKVSLLIQKVREDSNAMEQIRDFLKIKASQLDKTLKMISFDQGALINTLAEMTGLNFSEYLNHSPVYLNYPEVKDLLQWGFEIGGHSFEHVDFTLLDTSQMVEQIKESIENLQKRFDIGTRYFSFPFSSDGVPLPVIESLLDEGIAEVLMGTAGLKHTGRKGFIQRIPMEAFGKGAEDALKTEYLYYLLKKPLGRNRLR